MAESSASIKFRARLAELYPSSTEMRMVLKDCGLAVGAVDLQHKPIVAWFAILDYAETQKATKTLIERVLQDFQDALAALAAAYLADLKKNGMGDTQLSGLSTEESVSIVVTGLEVARTKLQDGGDGADLAATQRERLEAILQQIDILKTYKGLHDALQKFQYATGSFASLRKAAGLFPTDWHQKEALTAFQTRLGALCTLSRAAVLSLPDLPTLRDVEAHWLGRLEQSSTGLTDGLDAGLRDDVLVALNAIRHVLRVVPARLSEQLFVLARALPLAELGSTLDNLVKTLPTSDPAIQQLNMSRKVVDVLSSSIGASVAEHRRWQEVDNRLTDLRQLADTATPGELVMEFVPTWVEVKSRVKALIDLEPDGHWGRLVSGYSQSIDDRLAGEQIDAEFKLQFEGYIDEAQHRFIDVDLKVKNECALLVEMGVPLRALLEG